MAVSGGDLVLVVCSNDIILFKRQQQLSSLSVQFSPTSGYVTTTTTIIMIITIKIIIIIRALFGEDEIVVGGADCKTRLL